MNSNDKIIINPQLKNENHYFAFTSSDYLLVRGYALWKDSGLRINGQYNMQQVEHHRQPCILLLLNPLHVLPRKYQSYDQGRSKNHKIGLGW